MKFTRLLVIRVTDERDNQGLVKWLCKCDCGNTLTVGASYLKKGNTKSCGCLQKEAASKNGITTHGMSNSHEYNVWRGILKRCFNNKNDQYKNYGARGITVCRSWLKFENFIADMGIRPDGMSIERIDNNGNYCPENCKWATYGEQCSNKRTNVYLYANGRCLTIAQWSAETGINRQTLYWRSRQKWPVDRMFSSAPV